MRILGLSCDFHDAAAAIVEDGHIVAAAEEERFSRVKHDNRLPASAISSCLAIAGCAPDDIDVVVFHEKPLLTASRALAAQQQRGPRGLSGFVRDFPVLLRRNLMIAARVDDALRELGATRTIPLKYSEHHLSHASAAFYPSPFASAAVLTVDGIGEWATATVGHGIHHRLDLLAEQRYPNSLGLMYSLITIWCGFEPNDGEYKVMGLAPFGEPRFVDAMEEIAPIADDGSIAVDLRSVGSWRSRPGRVRRLIDAFDGPPHDPALPLTQREADLATSSQVYVERSLVRMAEHLHALTGESNLCMAGGVALNCVANGKLLREGPFDDIWVQPAAGDAGSAVGAALWYWHDELANPRRPTGDVVVDAMRGAALGPSFGTDEIVRMLSAEGIDHVVISDESERTTEVARRIADGAIVGWFAGPMEFGPRALGHRSILADPRSATVRSDVNLRVKGRESFRPFAPAVMWEHAAEWFDLDRPSPYMLFVHQVQESKQQHVSEEPSGFEARLTIDRSEIAACTHIDGSARVQTVHPETNPLFHRLLDAFRQQTGCPVLLNTSFNVAGEPIVCTPIDALRTARAAHLDLLDLEDCVIELRTPDADHAAPAAAGAAVRR